MNCTKYRIVTSVLGNVSLYDVNVEKKALNLNVYVCMKLDRTNFVLTVCNNMFVLRSKFTIIVH